MLQRRAAFRVSVETEVGARPPLHCTATGKAVVAHLSEAHARGLLGDGPFEQFTYRTLTTLDAVLAELAHVRQRGYAIDDEELNAGVRCVAAPVFGLEGAVVGCIGVSGPTQRLGIDRVPAVAELVMAAASRVTAGLGGPVAAVPAERGTATEGLAQQDRVAIPGRAQASGPGA